MKTLPTITVSGLALSDLFFNSPLENYNRKCDQAVNDESVGSEEINKALFQDAEEFSSLLDNQVAPEQLVEDFLSRV